MNLPALLFGFLLASGLGLIFHLLRGGPPTRLLLYLVGGWIGFGGGHAASAWLDLRLVRVGAINLLPAILGGLLALGLIEFLAPATQAAGRPPPDV